MKRKTMLLGLGSMIMVAAPLTATISCGGFDELDDQQDQGLDLGTDKPDENKPTTFDVGLSPYKPYNFEIKESFYSVIAEQASDEHKTEHEDDDFDHDGIDYTKANNWLKMIAPTQEGKHMAGVDVWLANEIAAKYNKGDVVLHEHKFEDLIPELNNNSFDAIISGMTATESRANMGVIFTEPYWQPKNGVLYVKDSQFGAAAVDSQNFDNQFNLKANTLFNFHGAVEKNSTQQEILLNFLGADANEKAEGSDNVELAVSSLVSDETPVDYVMCENTLYDYFKTEYHQDTPPVELGFSFVSDFNKVVDNISVGLPKNAVVTVEQVNQVINEHKSSVSMRFVVASDISLENHKDKYVGHTSATK